jgi:hypothetical protein
MIMICSDEEDYDVLEYHDSASLRKARWVPNAPVIFLIHGFTQSQNSSMPGVIKDGKVNRYEPSQSIETNETDVCVNKFPHLQRILRELRMEAGK